jgi:hypothetical protein
MKTLRYFAHCKTLDAVKAEYKKLAQQWLVYGDNPGDATLFDAIEQEYLLISQRPKFKQMAEEVQQEFIGFPNIVKSLVKLGLDLEMCGSWLWISGDTISCKEELKEMGLRYSPNKKMWYYRPVWSRSNNSSPTSLDYIRRKYGSDTVEQYFVFDRPLHNKPAFATNPGKEAV